LNSIQPRGCDVAPRNARSNTPLVNVHYPAQLRIGNGGAWKVASSQAQLFHHANVATHHGPIVGNRLRRITWRKSRGKGLDIFVRAKCLRRDWSSGFVRDIVKELDVRLGRGQAVEVSLKFCYVGYHSRNVALPSGHCHPHRRRALGNLKRVGDCLRWVCAQALLRQLLKLPSTISVSCSEKARYGAGGISTFTPPRPR
jgi:hypothetical protein